MADDHLIPNTTQVPNAILDWLMPFLNDGEVRVLMYLCRRTYGFQRESDAVSLDQFTDGIRSGERQLDFGAGVSRQGAMNALAVLKGFGIVEQLSGGRGRGNIPVYKINLKCEIVKWLDLIRQDIENVIEKIVERLDLIRKKSLPYGPFHRKPANGNGSEEKVNNVDLKEKVKTTKKKGLTVRPTKPSNTKPRKEDPPEATNVASTPEAPAYPPDDMRHVWEKGSKRVPKDFPREPTDEMFGWATTETPHVDVRFEHGAFIDYTFPKPHTDWYASWRGWMRRAERDAKKELNRQQARASPRRYGDLSAEEQARRLQKLKEIDEKGGGW